MPDVVNSGDQAPPAPDPAPAQGTGSPQQDAAPPPPAQPPQGQPRSTEPGPIPYQRFKFVNDQLKAMRQELERLQRQPPPSAPRTAPARPQQGQQQEGEEDPYELLAPHMGRFLSPLQEQLAAIQHERQVDQLMATTRAAVAEFPDVREQDVYMAIQAMTVEQAAQADPYEVAKQLQADFDTRYTARSGRVPPADGAPVAGQSPAASATRPQTPPRPRNAAGQFQSPGDDRMPDGRSWRSDPDERHRRALIARGLPLPAKYRR